MAIADILERNRRDAPDREAVVCGDLRLTYAEVGARVDRLAAVLLELGLGRGARVAVLEKNCHRFLELYFAAAQVGTVLVPLNYRLAARELAEILADSEAGAIFVGWNFLPLLESFRGDVSRLKQIVVFADEAPDGASAYEALLRAANGAPAPAAGSADELLYLYYTSGTTGRPKGAMLTESNIVFNARTVATHAGFTSADRYLHVAPMFHLADAGAIWSVTLGGGTHVCLADFEPGRCVELLERERITATVLVPTMINFVLNSPRAANADFSAWRVLIYGASPMPETLIRRAASTFGVQLMQAYGMTELSPVATWLSADEHQLEGPETVVRRLRSAGRAVPGVEVRVVDGQDRDVPLGEVGEVIVRGPNVMQGYWNQPEVTAQALLGGWMHTGDMATQDEDGYLYIVDRKKDMIISGGENVYSPEVEDVLFQHPALLEAAVIGVPDATWGEAVKAIVVVKDGQHVSTDELRAFCRQRIAGYKVPRSFEFVDALPKTATGKVSKKDLRAPYWAAQSGHGHLTDALLPQSTRSRFD